MRKLLVFALTLLFAATLLPGLADAARKKPPKHTWGSGHWDVIRWADGVCGVLARHHPARRLGLDAAGA